MTVNVISDTFSYLCIETLLKSKVTVESWSITQMSADIEKTTSGFYSDVSFTWSRTYY